jgi:hypothetical protein
VQLPAVDPAVPATLGPMRLDINRGVRHFAQFPVLLVPDTTSRVIVQEGVLTSTGGGLFAQ